MGIRFRPAYWSKSEFNFAEKANHPVLYVGYNNAVRIARGWRKKLAGRSACLAKHNGNARSGLRMAL